MPPVIGSKDHISVNYSNTQVVQTYGARLDDGTVIELVLPPNSAALQLVVWNSDSSTIVDRLTCRSLTYTPPELDASLREAVTWPSELHHHVSTHHLVQEIIALFTTWCGVSVQTASLLTAFGLSTWMRGNSLDVPNLMLIGLDFTQTKRVLRILNCLCRRALMFGPVDTATLASFKSLCPTALIDGRSIGPSTWAVLQMSSDAYVSRGKGVTTIPFPKVVYVEELRDDEKMDLSLVVYLEPSQAMLPPLDRDRCAKIASQLQPKLLSYRISNHARTAETAPGIQKLCPEVGDLARALCSSIIDDVRFQAAVVEQLRLQDQSVRIERASRLDCSVIEVLLALCRAEGTKVYVYRIAELTNVLLASREEKVRVTPRKIGAILTGLGIRTGRLGKAGRGILLDREQCLAISRLAERYGVEGIETACSTGT